MTLWRWLIVLRIVLTLLPQTGYIHPDEFFQSIEVVAGDVLDVQVQLPWEFNSSVTKHPIRNVLIPYVVVGMPLYFLKCLSELSEILLDVSLLSPYLVLVLPRLFMLVFSLCTDSIVYRLCTLFQRDHARCLSVYASSHVVLVFLTRTLSNSIESFLFAALLAMACEDIHRIDQMLKKKRNRVAVDVDTDRKFHWLGAITAVGLFNRPTFLAFAFMPLSIWILYGIDETFNRRMAIVVRRCLSLVPAFAATSALMIVADTLYYGHAAVATTVLLRWDLLLSIRWIVTPFNFLSYNLSGKNLLRHGLHPHYVHLLVNNVLLFGVLGIIGLVQYVRMLYAAFVKRLGDVHLIDRMCACGFVFPILILSFAPHQEPRFIEPVLLPLVFLHADKLSGDSAWTTRLACFSWIVLNLVGTVFFGFLHQGGVVQSVAFIQQSITRADTIAAVDHVVYYHTYMPPTSLLLRPKTSEDCSALPELQIHDLMGLPSDELRRQLEKLRGTVLVVSPTSVRQSVLDALKPFQVHLHTRFWMHLSMEDPPPLDGHFLNRLGLDLHLVDVWKNVTRVQYLSAA